MSLGHAAAEAERDGPADGPAIFLAAGEASGDRHGAAIARALHDRIPGVRLLGIGGEAMERAGVELLAGLDDLAVMGFAEVARRLPFFLRLRRRVDRRIREADARLVLPIDYPGFNLRLAARAHRQGRKVLYFIAPQVWAWKERRAGRMARDCDRVLTVLPFETELLERYGVDVEFVGHPLLDEIPARQVPRAPGPEGQRVLGVFPGSRAQEIERILPLFAETARTLVARTPRLEAVVARAPSLPETMYADCGLPTATPEEVRERAFAALTKSGTITLELALDGIPMVVAYRTSRATYALARRLVDVPYIALVNLVADELLVPEFVQDAATPTTLAAALAPILEPASPARANMLAGYERVRARLGEPGCAGRVADRAAELLS